MQDVVFAALLVVDDELDGDVGAIRPLRIGRVASVTDHVARILAGHEGTSGGKFRLEKQALSPDIETMIPPWRAAVQPRFLIHR